MVYGGSDKPRPFAATLAWGAALLAEIDEAVRAANEAVALDESVAAMHTHATRPAPRRRRSAAAVGPRPRPPAAATPRRAAALELPGAAPPAEGLQAKGKKGWRTYQPSVISASAPTASSAG